MSKIRRLEGMFVNNGTDEAILQNMGQSNDIEKALNREGLVQRQVTYSDKYGTHNRMQWVRANDAPAVASRPVQQPIEGQPSHKPLTPSVNRVTEEDVFAMGESGKRYDTPVAGNRYMVTCTDRMPSGYSSTRKYSIVVNNVEERSDEHGDFYYFGYTPDDKSNGQFGYSKQYKDPAVNDQFAYQEELQFTGSKYQTKGMETERDYNGTEAMIYQEIMENERAAVGDTPEHEPFMAPEVDGDGNKMGMRQLRQVGKQIGAQYGIVSDPAQTHLAQVVREDLFESNLPYTPENIQSSIDQLGNYFRFDNIANTPEKLLRQADGYELYQGISTGTNDDDVYYVQNHDSPEDAEGAGIPYAPYYKTTYGAVVNGDFDGSEQPMSAFEVLKELKETGKFTDENMPD